VVAGISSAQVDQAVKMIRAGGLGVFPTDTVYAIGCSALDLPALNRLYALRKRPKEKALLLNISGLSMLSTVVEEITPLAEKLIRLYWPGPLTIVFKRRKNSLPDRVNSHDDTIAVRWPNCEIENELLKACGVPLVAPSANPVGLPPALNIAEAREYFKDDCDFYLDGGPCQSAEVSTIVDLSSNTPRILRAGAIVFTKSDFMIE
jgi:L-threonylcarbamoyladenylate synthase